MSGSNHQLPNEREIRAKSILQAYDKLAKQEAALQELMEKMDLPGVNILTSTIAGIAREKILNGVPKIWRNFRGRPASFAEREVSLGPKRDLMHRRKLAQQTRKLNKMLEEGNLPGITSKGEAEPLRSRVLRRRGS